ncbi:hypothetical protein ACS0TY_008059 [Phlomoides rotata]
MRSKKAISCWRMQNQVKFIAKSEMVRTESTLRLNQIIDYPSKREIGVIIPK